MKRMESKVAKPARLQGLIVIILECTRFNYSPKRICHNIAACIVLISGKLRILLLNILPALKLLKDGRQKRNRTNGILTFRGLDHDFRCGLSGLQGPLHLVQPVQRPADMQNTGAEINILPAQAKQFPKPQAGKKNETDKHAVAVLIAALHQAGLFVSCQYYDLRLASSRKIHAICGITVDIADASQRREALLEAFRIDPYLSDWYLLALQSDGNPDGKLQEAADYFDIPGIASTKQ